MTDNRKLLERAQRAVDDAYTIRRTVFEQIRDDKWFSLGKSEHSFMRRQVDGSRFILNLERDTLREQLNNRAKWTTRKQGVDYVLDLIEQNGGVMPEGHVPPVKEASGPLFISPPYNLKSLSEREYAIHERLPPAKEQLEKFVRYHAESGLLYFCRPSGIAEYEEVLSGPAYFIKIDGTYYARWRVISQLVADNPYGVYDIEANAELLDKVVTVDHSVAETLHKMYLEMQAHMSESGEGFKYKPIPTVGEKINSRAEEIRARRERFQRETEEEMSKFAEARAERRRLRKEQKAKDAKYDPIPELYDELLELLKAANLPSNQSRRAKTRMMKDLLEDLVKPESDDPAPPTPLDPKMSTRMNNLRRRRR